MRTLIALLLMLCQVGGNGSGRTTGARGVSGTSIVFYPSIATINCTGTTCTANSGTVSPGSHVVSGPILFTPSADANFTFSGLEGGGAGQLEYSCDGGSTWSGIAAGMGVSGNPVSYSYHGTSCTGPTNLNTVLVRTNLSGGGALPVTMSFLGSSSITISW